MSELAEQVPEQVAFQQSPATTVDDLVVTASSADPGSSLRLEIAARRRPKFIMSDPKTRDLVTALVRADLEVERTSDLHPGVDHRLAVAVAGLQKHAEEVSELALVARGQATSDDFFELVYTPGKFASRSRLKQLESMVEASLVEIGDKDVGTVRHRCWSLLRRLWVMQLRLEPDQDADWTALVDDLRPLAIGGSHEAAVALRDRLEQLSGELARTAGVVDAALLRRRLHGQIASGVHAPSPGLKRLLALDNEARRSVARTLTGEGATNLTLGRNAARKELVDALASGRDLIVKGDSGVGKSALVMDAIDPAKLDANYDAIAVNLRYLPSDALALVSLLSAPLEKLFDELTAPSRYLVIDGVEAAAESHGHVFGQLVRSESAWV